MMPTGQEKTKYVLLLDEEPFIQDTLKLKFAAQGLKTVTVDSEAQAKKLLETRPPQAVILDLMHSRLPVYSFVQWLKGQEKTKDIPLIILTFKDKDPEMEFTYNVWAEEYFTKPFSPREVVKRVTEIIRRGPR